MLAPRAFEARVAAFFRDRGLSLEAPALLGLSGGPDSTALASALVGLGAGPLRALHVDHGIRPEAERRAELELVGSLCAGLGLPLSIARVRPGAVLELAEASGEGLEAAARRFRRAAFRSRLARFGLERLYLGHNRDDRLETLLMRLLGGSGAAGLSGLPPVSSPLYRPLIGFSKAEILDYLRQKRLPFSLDSSNADESLLRNRIRLSLVPLLRASFPGWERGLELAADKALRDEAALGLLAEGLEFREDSPGRLAIAEGRLWAAPEALRIRALVKACGRLKAGSGRGGESGPGAGLALDGSKASSRLARAALAALERGERYRGGGFELRREGGLLVLEKELDFKGRAGYFLEVDRPGAGVSLLRAGRLRATVGWAEGPGARGPLEGAFAFPLLLRSRRSGDSLSLRSGSKPIDELLSEWGVPSELRDFAPVLEDRAGIVAVLGSAVGGRDRYRHREGLPQDGRRLSIALKGA